MGQYLTKQGNSMEDKFKKKEKIEQFTSSSLQFTGYLDYDLTAKSRIFDSIYLYSRFSR